MAAIIGDAFLVMNLPVGGNVILVRPAILRDVHGCGVIVAVQPDEQSGEALGNTSQSMAVYSPSGRTVS